MLRLRNLEDKQLGKEKLAVTSTKHCRETALQSTVCFTVAPGASTVMPVALHMELSKCDFVPSVARREPWGLGEESLL